MVKHGLIISWGLLHIEIHFVGRKKKQNRKENGTGMNGGKKGTCGSYINTENSVNEDQDSWRGS